MEERCENCKCCYTLYIPPTINSDARDEYCCTLFLDEGQVMYLGNDIYGKCEEFAKR